MIMQNPCGERRSHRENFVAGRSIGILNSAFSVLSTFAPQKVLPNLLVGFRVFGKVVSLVHGWSRSPASFFASGSGGTFCPLRGFMVGIRFC